MLYLVAYLIGGEAGKWHRRRTGEIAEKFEVPDLAKRIPPHLTMFPPTELSDPDNMKRVISQWREKAGACSQQEVVLNDLGCWGRRVVYVDVSVGKLVRQKVAELRVLLDEELGTNVHCQAWKPHASLARRTRPEKIDEVWKYVSGWEKLWFSLPFDHIAVLRHQEGRWEKDEVFVIDGKG